jgi:hypothetical protein
LEFLGFWDFLEFFRILGFFFLGFFGIFWGFKIQKIRRFPLEENEITYSNEILIGESDSIAIFGG